MSVGPDPILKVGKCLMYRYTIGVSYSNAAWPNFELIQFKGNFTLGHIKDSWLASSPAHKRPHSGFFFIKKTPTFIDQCI
jgi:hypothetical protein